MPQDWFIQLLAHFEGLVFTCLGGYAVLYWWRHRERGIGYLATALILLGLTALLGQVTSFTGSTNRLLQDVTIFAFLGSGYALLGYRNQVIPIGGLGRVGATLVVAATAVCSLVADFPSKPGAPTSAFQLFSAFLLLGVWAFCVGEPAFRFWRASRGRSSVQRARLRALSTGYGAIVLLLALGVVGGGPKNPAINVIVLAGASATAPLLFAAFAPPSWLRRRWRRSEEGAYRRATQALVGYVPTIHDLGERAVEWAIRLLGAEGGALISPDGEILAARGLAAESALSLVRRADDGSATDHASIVLPVETGPGLGHLVVVGGPYTPFFGSDEVAHLADYAGSVGAALTRVQMNQDLDQQTRRFEQLLAAVSDIGEGLLITEGGKLVYGNDAYCRLTGYSQEELAGLGSLLELAPEDERQELADRLTARMAGGPVPYQYQSHLITKDGRTIPVEAAVRLLPPDGVGRMIAIVRDISERQAHIAELEYRSLHDGLTGLPNRGLLADRLQQVVLNADRAGESFGLLLMDFDRFKEVNDTLGHDTGDTLLCAIADRLAGTLRESDTVARLGGDEFAVLPGAGNGVLGAEVMAAKILKDLQAPFVVHGHVVDANASIGVAVFPQHGRTAEALLRCADVAMYVAKRERSGYKIYSPEEDLHAMRRLNLAGQLREAIAKGELVVHYQPVADLRRGFAVSAEALVRWQHPEEGLLYPDQFIPLAEESGVIGPLARWVLAETAKQMNAWRQQSIDIGVSVNLSMRNLQDPELPAFVSKVLLATGTPAERLTLELTESTVMSPIAIRAITRLHEVGVRLSIDDFGTGYSSLAYLKSLPVQELKIDRAFVTHLASDPGDAAIVEPTITLGHNLGLTVVAEGVEDVRTAELLQSYGCDLVQGFAISPPLPAAEFTAWLRDSRWAARSEASAAG